MLPFSESAYNVEWIFQHDNALMHTITATKEFFMDRVVFVMDWPSCSPDLNPIKNLQGILVRLVYKDFRQFDTFEDLREAVETAWDHLDPNTLKNLVNSMQKRCERVIKSNGGPTGF